MQNFGRWGLGLFTPRRSEALKSCESSMVATLELSQLTPHPPSPPSGGQTTLQFVQGAYLGDQLEEAVHVVAWVAIRR